MSYNINSENVITKKIQKDSGSSRKIHIDKDEFLNKPVGYEICMFDPNSLSFEDNLKISITSMKQKYIKQYYRIMLNVFTKYLGDTGYIYLVKSEEDNLKDFIDVWGRFRQLYYEEERKLKKKIKDLESKIEGMFVDGVGILRNEDKDKYMEVRNTGLSKEGFDVIRVRKDCIKEFTPLRNDLVLNKNTLSSLNDIITEKLYTIYPKINKSIIHSVIKDFEDGTSERLLKTRSDNMLEFVSQPFPVKNKEDEKPKKGKYFNR